VGLRVVQENDAFSEHPAPFLDQTPKLIQRFTINL